MHRSLVPRLILVLTLAVPVFGGEKEEALLVAVRKGDAAAVKSLLAQGADANAKYRYDRSILSFATDRGNPEIVKALLDSGADPNAKDTFYSATPMTWAVDKGYAEIVRLLLEKGATGREDALLSGAGEGHTEMVKMLLSLDGWKAETLAQAYGRAERGKHEETLAALKAAGATPPPKPQYKVPEGDLPKYAGKYTSAAQGAPEITFTVKDGKLIGGPPGQSLTLAAFDRENFTLVEFDAVRLKFKFEGDKVVGMFLKQGSFEADYKRVEEKKE
jgi:hypothetical protein